MRLTAVPPGLCDVLPQSAPSTAWALRKHRSRTCHLPGTGCRSSRLVPHESLQITASLADSLGTGHSAGGDGGRRILSGPLGRVRGRRAGRRRHHRAPGRRPALLCRRGCRQRPTAVGSALAARRDGDHPRHRLESGGWGFCARHGPDRHGTATGRRPSASIGAAPPAKVDSRGWLVVRRADRERSGASGGSPATADTGADNRPPAAAPAAPPCRVRSLAIQASLGHWGPGTAPDGLILNVAPLDDLGDVLPVDATIEVDLTGELVGADRPSYPFLRIGRWTQWVRAGDFGPQGAVVKLPFSGTPPEFDPRLGTWGNVHARLSVAGQGVFEASQSTTRWPLQPGPRPTGAGHRPPLFHRRGHGGRPAVIRYLSAAAPGRPAHPPGFGIEKACSTRTEPADKRAQPIHSGGWRDFVTGSGFST